MLRFTALVLLIFNLSACSVNGIGPGFDVQRYASKDGVIEVIEGNGVYLDTRAPSASLGIGYVKRTLLCPSPQTSEKPELTANIYEQSSPRQVTHEFQSHTCSTVWTLHRSRTGLSLDYHTFGFRLLAGHQQQYITNIANGTTVLLHVAIKNGNLLQGKIIPNSISGENSEN